MRREIEERDGGSNDDRSLVEGVRRGDSRAFDQLVRTHVRIAHHVAQSILDGNVHDAEDVVQEAFIKALEKIDECLDPDRFRAWLLTIVKNTAHNRREYEGVRSAVPLDEVQIATREPGPGRRLERSELETELEEAVSHLTDLQRRTFELYDLEGLSHREIADELRISVNASRYHLHIARGKIRENLSSHSLVGSQG